MRIAETASHRPFQDHELSMSRHIPEQEHFGQGGQESQLRTEPEIAGKGGGDVNPLTPTMGVVGEIGRTPIPVAESTCHPGEKPLTPVMKHVDGRTGQKGESPTPVQRKEGTTGEPGSGHRGGEPEWALPKPSDPRRPLRGGMGREEVPLQDTQGQNEGPSGQECPTPNQQLIEVDKRRRKRLAALARDHIMKLREE